MFVNNATIAEVADEMQALFECGSLHSRSNVNAVAREAAEFLADRGLPTRSSLCCIVAKVALMRWHETIHQTKEALR